jgi:hypothetical protein
MAPDYLKDAAETDMQASERRYKFAGSGPAQNES